MQGFRPMHAVDRREFNIGCAAWAGDDDNVAAGPSQIGSCGETSGEVGVKISDGQ